MPFDVPISVGCIPMVRIAGHRIGLYVCQLKLPVFQNDYNQFMPRMMIMQLALHPQQQ